MVPVAELAAFGGVPVAAAGGIGRVRTSRMRDTA